VEGGGRDTRSSNVRTLVSEDGGGGGGGTLCVCFSNY